MTDRKLTVLFIGLALIGLCLIAGIQAVRDKNYTDLLDKAMVVVAALAPSPLSKSSTASEEVKVVNNPDEPIPTEDV